MGSIILINLSLDLLSFSFCLEVYGLSMLGSQRGK
jgi:hypothetical protein